MYGIIVAALGTCEIGLLCVAGFALFRKWGNTFAEAVVYAIITAMMVLSCLFQIAFLLGDPALSVGPEEILCLVSVVIAFRLRRHLVMAWKTMQDFFSGNRVAACILCIGWCYLCIRAIFFQPGAGPWDSLDHVLFFQQHGTSFSFPFSGPFSGDGQALFPINNIILSHMFLRFNTGFGVGIFGFLAYISATFSIYALARRYSWPPTAFTVTVAVMTMPRLVFLAVSPGEEIIPAAVAVFCLLAINRVIEQPNIKDLILLILGILFGISGKTMCFTFPVILLTLSCVLLFRRHGAAIWRTIIIGRPWISVPALLPALIFSQSWLFLYNIQHYGRWIGLSTGIPKNIHGIQGSLANFVRYMMESIHVTLPADIVCKWMFDFSVTDILNRIYGLFSFFGNSGAGFPFEISRVPDAVGSWFGPFGFLLVLPAVFFAMFRGHRRIKAIAVALAGYLYIITLVFAWIPGNARFLTVFYMCGGCCTAFLLPPWRFTRVGKQVIQVISVLLFFYVCMMI